METQRPWLGPTPLCATGRPEKRPNSGGERKSEGKKTREGRAKGRRSWIEDEEGGDRGEPKHQGGKEKDSERVGSLVALKLVRSQSRVHGMKTGGAVCHSQAWDSTLPEKKLLSPPKCALSSPPFPPHPSSHPSASLLYCLTTSRRCSNTFKQARWAQWTTPHCLHLSKSL